MKDILHKIQAIREETDRIDSGWCMCGGSMSSHTGFSDHTPVDAMAYHMDSLLATLQELVEEKERESSTLKQ